MMAPLTRICARFILPLLPMAALAQPATTGTAHWVTFMENLDLQFNTSPYFELVISSETSTMGEVLFPSTGYSIPFSVGAMQDTVITLPTNVYYGLGDEAVFDHGMKVVSDDPVSVYAYHHRLYFSEAAVILPEERLGTDYVVLAHEDDLYGHPSEFVVLATRDSTTVSITPSVLTAGFRPPGVPFTVLLDAGQSFQLKAYGDLSGSRITVADPAKPVALFAGAQQAAINCSMAADDHLYQQIEPFAAWGHTYDIVPFKDRGGDQVRILASADGTQVSITGQPAITLDSAQTADVTIAVPSRITSSAPVCVGQFNESQSCNPAIGDPCYLYVQPADRADQRALWSALTGAGTPHHYVNVVAPGDAVPPIVHLDGVNVSGQLVPMAGAPEVYTAQFAIAEGPHELYCPTGCLGSAYGFGDYNSYAFHLGYGPAQVHTAVQEQDTRPSATAIVLPAGGILPARTLGSGTWIRLAIMDATGRQVLADGPGDHITLRLPPGHYVVHVADHTGAESTRRLVVEP